MAEMQPQLPATPGEEIGTQLPAVAFDIAFGEYAKRNDCIYDVDPRVFAEALVAGGLSASAVSEQTVVISSPKDLGLKGKHSPREGSHPGDNEGSMIWLYSFRGTTPISTRTVAHEGRHAADWDEGIVNEHQDSNVKLLRKAGAFAGAFAVGLGITCVFSRVGVGLPYTFGASMVSMQSVMSSLFVAEYMTRSHERKARLAERTVADENVLIVEGGSQRNPKYLLRRAAGLVVNALIPNPTL